MNSHTRVNCSRLRLRQIGQLLSILLCVGIFLAFVAIPVYATEESETEATTSSFYDSPDPDVTIVTVTMPVYAGTDVTESQATEASEATTAEASQTTTVQSETTQAEVTSATVEGTGRTYGAASPAGNVIATEANDVTDSTNDTSSTVDIELINTTESTEVLETMALSASNGSKASSNSLLWLVPILVLAIITFLVVRAVKLRYEGYAGKELAQEIFFYSKFNKSASNKKSKRK